MKILYKCEYCNKQFDNQHQCAMHELSHLDEDASVRYYIQNIMRDSLCKYCTSVYYVYGCELNCDYRTCGPENNYENFKLKGV